MIDGKIGKLKVAVGLVDKTRNFVDSAQRNEHQHPNHDSDSRHDQVL